MSELDVKIPRKHVLLLVLLGLALVACREVIVRSGELTADQGRVVDVGLAGLFVAVGVWVVDTRGMTAVVAVLGAATATVAFLQLVFPATPAVQAAGTCDGARLARAPFLATTTSGGVNARSGPGRSFSPTLRFGGDCTLGFVSYCIGEPALDEFLLPTFHVYDTRWLELPKGDGWVAAGVVRAQRPETVLQQKGECPTATSAPERPTMTIEPSPATGETVIRATAPNAFTVGFAALADTDDPESPVIRRIGLDAFADPDFTATWWTSDQMTAGDGLGRGSVLAVAVVCYAAEVPSELVDARVVELDNPDGRPGSTAANRAYDELPPAVRDRLGRTACLLPDPPVGQPAPPEFPGLPEDEG